MLGSDSSEPSFGSVGGWALPYRQRITRDCRRIPGTLTCCCISQQGMGASALQTACTGAKVLRIGRIQRCWQYAVLEIRRVRGEGQKCGRFQRDCTMDSQAPVPNMETGLQLVNVSGKRVGNATNTLSQQVVENCEGRVSRASDTAKSVH